MSWNEHNEYNLYRNKIFQLIIGFSLEKVLHYSNFWAKKWESVILCISETLNKTLIKSKQNEEINKPDFDKPDPLMVKIEADVMRSLNITKDDITETPSLINQLGRIICDDN